MEFVKNLTDGQLVNITIFMVIMLFVAIGSSITSEQLQARGIGKALFNILTGIAGCLGGVAVVLSIISLFNQIGQTVKH